MAFVQNKIPVVQLHKATLGGRVEAKKPALTAYVRLYCSL